eukprot:TRINITY_DN13216_c0_g1_i1.p1 TRINITY_DN13216_c0_g1~~TRINITY_DN13216_c0_g1_i1.p1  ORF type:complete len:178 (-),score=40.86 TRINITY_DN13216_c0_g1_i1:25-558(-)
MISCDVVAANNYSHFGLMERAQMLAYFAGCFKGLDSNGMLVIDVYGGEETKCNNVETISTHRAACRDGEEVEFKYIYEQAEFDPVKSTQRVRVHFEFEDGSQMTDAFTYPWRLYTVHELDELLLEAGFKETKLFIDGHDDEGDYEHATECVPNWRESFEAELGGEDFFSCYLAAYKY